MSISNEEDLYPRLIHHAAQRGMAQFPPSSLPAIQDCLDSGAMAIEVDILPLADGNFVLLHDPDLSNNTEGTGNACTMTRAELSSLHYLHHGKLSPHLLTFLDQAIKLVTQNPNLEKFQLDLKPQTPLTPALIQALLDTIQPAFERIQVTSVADWAIRALNNAFPTLNLGFDPLLYLDVVDNEPRPPQVPPFRTGAYGLLDDHPLSAYVWGQPKVYFAARAEALFRQAADAQEWFIRAETLLHGLSVGFDWVEFLHQHGRRVDAWTIDPPNLEVAEKLLSLGVDELTSNAPVTLAKSLSHPCRF